MKQRWLISVLSTFLVFILLLSGCSGGNIENEGEDSLTPQEKSESAEVTLPSDSTEASSSESEENNSDVSNRSEDFVIPVYTGTEVVQINGNIPNFQASVEATEDYVKFSEQDSLGRCGVAEGYIGPNILPTEERGSIGMIKPSGWHTVKYSFIDGKYLYNRCHLIAYELCGVNDDTRNLITGTRHLNLDGMLNIEDQVYYHNEANTTAPVITVSGSGANAGFARMYFEDVFASDCSFADSGSTQYLFFVYCFLKENKSQLDALQKGSAQPHVYAKDINAMVMKSIPKQRLEQFCGIVKPYFEMMGNLEKQSKSAVEARDRLLPKLMSGEIEI